MGSIYRYASYAGEYTGAGGLLTLDLGPLESPYIAYECVDGKTSTVRLVPNIDGTTTVIDLSTGKKQRLNLAQYTNGAVLKPTYQEGHEPYNKINFFTGLFISISLVFMIYLAFSDDYKRYRLRRVIAVSARET